jgi:transposase InsO family protein
LAHGAKKILISQEIRDNSENLYSVDTKELWLFQKKYYILVAVGHTGKVSYARAYLSHSSKVAADFLDRLKFLVNGNLSVILTDNGSEFQKDFEAACRQSKLTRYYSRVRTPKDNPEVERMTRTLIYEWLNDGNCHENLYLFNKSITEFLIIYNSIRPINPLTI